MNLVKKDACNLPVLKQVVEVQKYFTSVHVPHDLLKKRVDACLVWLTKHARILTHSAKRFRIRITTCI